MCRPPAFFKQTMSTPLVNRCVHNACVLGCVRLHCGICRGCSKKVASSKHKQGALLWPMAKSACASHLFTRVEIEGFHALRDEDNGMSVIVPRKPPSCEVDRRCTFVHKALWNFAPRSVQLC